MTNDKNLPVIHTQVMLGKNLKVYGTVEEPLFLAKDVADWIEHSNSRMMLKGVDEDEKVCVNNPYALKGQQEQWFLTEDGLYEVFMQSRKPIAKVFKKEVKYILKNIRKHGGHLTTEKIEEVLLNPDTIIQLAQNLKDEQEKRKFAEQAVIEANNIIEAQQPKVLFADSVSSSETSILIRELAKLLKQNGVDTGEKRFFDWLRENGYLIKRHGSDRNLPTQKSMDLGLFEIKETPVPRSKGVVIERTPKVTGKGQLYFINKFIKG